MELGIEGKNGWWYKEGSDMQGPLGIEHIYVELISDGELYNKISKCWIEQNIMSFILT